MYKNIIDKDWLMICQDDTSPQKIRLSWFKDCHFQDEVFINLFEPSKYDKKMITFDVYCLGTGKYCTFYCDYRNEWLIVDIWVYNKAEFVTHIYNLKELYKEN